MSAIETYAVSPDISGKRFLAAFGTAVGASAVTGALSYVLLRFLNSSSRSQAAPIWFAGIEVAREWPARKSRCVPRLLPRNHPGFEAGNNAVGNGLIDTRPVAGVCFPHGCYSPRGCCCFCLSARKAAAWDMSDGPSGERGVANGKVFERSFLGVPRFSVGKPKPGGRMALQSAGGSAP